MAPATDRLIVITGGGSGIGRAAALCARRGDRVPNVRTSGADHLRHTKFVGLRDDKEPSKVIKET